MNIVVLDGYTANPGDLSWDGFQDLGHLKVYDHSALNQVVERSRHADILVVNKVVLGEEHFIQLPHLKCICLLATGYDNVDIEAARKNDIVVCNAVGYGTDSVAQHVFSLILYWTNQVAAHNASVQKGEWFSRQWSYTIASLSELSGKSLGIAGFGRIGKKVAEIGRSFGMNILVLESSIQKRDTEMVNRVPFDEFLENSDFISLHLPLTGETQEIMNSHAFRRMKDSAILINTGRGGLIREEDLKIALDNGVIAGAALDVLSHEPPTADHILIGHPKCIITPHNAWATLEARRRMLLIVQSNIQGFIEGSPVNRVN